MLFVFKEKNQGFTLVEIIVSLSLLTMLAGLALAMSFDDYRAYSFFSEQNLLVGLLQKARSQSVNNIDQKPHGVYINRQPTRYILFEGLSFSARDPAQDIIFPGNGGYALSGLSEVVFSQLSGASGNIGNIIMDDHAHAPVVIGINREGQINSP